MWAAARLISECESASRRAMEQRILERALRYTTRSLDLDRAGVVQQTT